MTEITVRDARAQATWDSTYSEPNLDTSVWAKLPFVDTAVETFSTAEGPILELPCGGGRNTISLTSAAPAVVAVDASRPALDLAGRVLAREQVTNCVLVNANIFDLPFPDGLFAGVFCADLLGHLHDPREALVELARTCRPSAKLLVNFFGIEDSTRSDAGASIIGETELMYHEVYFRYDDEASVRRLVDVLALRLISLTELRWSEDPHPGYRDYPHEHHSLITLLERI